MDCLLISTQFDLILENPQDNNLLYTYNKNDIGFWVPFPDYINNFYYAVRYIFSRISKIVCPDVHNYNLSKIVTG